MITPRQLITAFDGVLSGLTYGSPSQAVFQTVEAYDETNIDEALRDLIIHENRVALIVIDKLWERVDSEGSVMRYSRYQSLALVVLNRDYEPGKASLLADNGALDMLTPVLGLHESNPTLGLAGGWLQFSDAQSVRIISKKVPKGREGLVVFYDYYLGAYEIDRPVGAMRA